MTKKAVVIISYAKEKDLNKILGGRPQEAMGCISAIYENLAAADIEDIEDLINKRYV